MIRKKNIQFIKSLSLLFCLSLFALNCRSQKNLMELTDSLFQGVYLVESYSKILEFGKEAIPYLINIIDRDKPGFIVFQDSTLSVFHPAYVGVRASHMIDCILANSKQLSSHEIIVKVIDNKSVMESLTYHDMKKIKVLYKRWWRKNKSKSLAELTEDWNNNKRPLTNSEYRWK